MQRKTHLLLLLPEKAEKHHRVLNPHSPRLVGTDQNFGNKGPIQPVNS